jgi:ribosome-associated protein
LTIKKRPSGDAPASKPAKKRTTKRAATPTPRAAPSARAKGPVRRATTPRIRASHGAVPDAPGSRPARPLRALSVDGGVTIKPRPAAPGPRKAPLTGPKRAASPAGRPRPPATSEAGPSTAARELALALAGAAIEKKAIGIEILDVTGKVDYADFLVVMTGRSDRHVHSIATGIEEEMRRKKHAPLSMEGLSAAIWVLIDFGDVVVHVFQEDARALYDIEGLWIDASRIPVPSEDGSDGRRHEAPSSSD